MTTIANELPRWTLQAPLHDASVTPDATIVDRVRASASSEAAELTINALPQISMAEEADAELVIEGVIGRGGMGVVHVAHQRALQREVAVKRLRPESALEATAISSLLIEARVQGALDHPNVVPVHALGRDTGNLPVLVMKRLSGVAWRALIRDPSHPAWPEEAGDRFTWHLETLMQICNAVHFAHSRGVIHRDIKPDNVMAGAFGEVYLLDWGIAYRPRSDDPIEPTIVGTPSYLAPEMLKGSGPHVTPRSDVYLLGSTLHEVLTGKVRHEGATVLEVLYRAEASEPFDYPPSVPEELALLCNRATSLDPSKRPESALEFRQAIADYLRHKSSIALAQAATARLRELFAQGSIDENEASLDDEASFERDALTRRLYGEASFGFKQALLSWDGNKAARDGAAALAAWMIEFELSHRNVDGAAALLAELPEPNRELLARVEALRLERSEEREELRRLRDIRRGLDPAVSFRPRLIVTASISGLGAVLLFGTWVINAAGPSHEDVILVLSAVSLTLVVVLIATRKNPLMTPLNRKLIMCLLLFFAAQIVNHVAAVSLLVPTDFAFAGDMLVGWVASSILAVSLPVTSGFWSVPALFLAGIVISTLFPSLAVPAHITVLFLCSLSIGTLSWRILRARERASVH